MQKNYPWILMLTIPPGCTGRTQPADVGLQKPVKDATRATFVEWALDDVQKQRKAGKKPEDIRINLRLSYLKPLVPLILLAGYTRLTTDIVQSAWRKSGILAAWESDVITKAFLMNEEGKLFTKSQLDELNGKEVDRRKQQVMMSHMPGFSTVMMTWHMRSSVPA